MLMRKSHPTLDLQFHFLVWISGLSDEVCRLIHRPLDLIFHIYFKHSAIQYCLDQCYVNTSCSSFYVTVKWVACRRHFVGTSVSPFEHICLKVNIKKLMLETNLFLRCVIFVDDGDIRGVKISIFAWNKLKFEALLLMGGWLDGWMEDHNAKKDYLFCWEQLIIPVDGRASIANLLPKNEA